MWGGVGCRWVGVLVSGNLRLWRGFQNYLLLRYFLHGVIGNGLYLSFSLCKAASLITYNQLLQTKCIHPNRFKTDL